MAGSVAAQSPQHTFKLRPQLQQRMAEVAEDAVLPVYFVMRDRLGYHHWYPRVATLGVAERRRLVVRELRAHAARTQEAVCAVLADAERRGDCTAVRRNWAGNFVQARATAEVIHAVAALDDVWEVWPDWRDAGAVEDTAPAGAGAAGAGNGPTEVGADLVWAMGFDGRGVTVMNADSGINVQHLALRNALWTNPGEIAGNGVDDDLNGFVDDLNGWDFGSDSNQLDDNGGHGTATAGVMVADGTCNGTVYGIAPGAEVMTGKLLLESSQWAAIQYALAMGADTQTSSHSYKNNFVPPPNYAMHRDLAEITLAAGLIRTNSTSNNGSVCADPTLVVQRPFNVAAPGNVPAPYLDPNQLLVGRLGGVIGVGSYDVNTGALSATTPCGPSAWHLNDLLFLLPAYPLANWDVANDNDYPWFGGTMQGLIKPDVVAPTNVDTAVSAGPSCLIRPLGGTSGATPVVMGCALLWKSANRSLTPEDVAMIVHRSARDGGSVPGKENTWGAGKVDAYAGTLMALAVHRVNGQPAWQVQHRAGAPLTFELDGSPGRPVLIALGATRQDVDFGILTSGIGSTMLQVYAGSTGPVGDAARVTVPVPPVATALTLFSQAFVDDTAGPSGRYLASNVIEIRIVP